MKNPAPFGYHGCYLRIDVSRGSVDRVPLPEAVLRQFLGGSGLGAWLLLEEGDPRADPLAAEAPLVFAFSPLVGSPLTTSAKFAVVSKSPLTDRINDSLASSGFAIAGKRCGCDAIVIVGRAAELSVLIVDDGRVRLESAEDLRGATCQATESTLKARLGADYQIASIGPAGERAVRYATISHDGRHAGRGGSGAVLGSKNVKAIAVRGTQRCEWAHPRELTEYSKNLSKRSFGPATAKYRELGTATNLLTFNRLGALPTRNFQSGTFEGVRQHLAGADPHHPHADTRQLRRLHHRVRAHLLDRRRERCSARIRESVRARFAVRRERPGCRAPRVQIVRRAGHRHDQRRRHHRLRHGVCRTRMARRALAHLRERRRACCARSS